MPTTSKIIEKAISIRFEKYLQENNIINKNQFGFITKSSTLSACSQLLNFVETNIDKKPFVICLFIDIKKAYDSVNHNILFNKLQAIGITHTTLRLFQSFQHNRKQYVSLNHNFSDMQHPKIGVAQGSMLSSAEFSLYMNDIFDLNFKGNIQLYADDAVLMFSSASIDQLIEIMQHDLDILKKYLELNKLQLNIEKTNYIIFDKYKTNESQSASIPTINNTVINKVTETKYLGLIIDSKLSRHQHINKIKNKIKPIIFAVKRHNNYLHTKAKHDIYNAHFLSHISYLNPIWSNASRYKLNEIKVLQNKMIKAMYGYSTREHTRLLYLNHTQIIPFDKLCKI